MYLLYLPVVVVWCFVDCSSLVEVRKKGAMSGPTMSSATVSLSLYHLPPSDYNYSFISMTVGSLQNLQIF
jgi:hypothetical protein